MTKTDATRKRSGQAIAMILAVILVCFAFFAWIVSVHTHVIRKLRAQDGGDAVALAVARVQAMGLNLIGELNLIKAYMLSEPEEKSTLEDVATLTLLQERLQITTLGHALAVGQVTALQNELTPNPAAADLLNLYIEHFDFEGFYEGAEEDLKDMLKDILEDAEQTGGLRFLPLSKIFVTSDRFSWLIDRNFYEAILAKDYCWFWFNAYSFLLNYNSRRDFGALPEMNATPLFDLKLRRKEIALQDLYKEVVTLEKENGQSTTTNVKSAFNQSLSDLGHPQILPPKKGEKTKWTTPQQWMTFDPSEWDEWAILKDPMFPIRSEVKEQYDYRGCSAVVQVEKDGVVWVAAAKAFGDLRGQNPTSAAYVLGGFTDVRLVPIDAAEPEIAGFDVKWIQHLSAHLEPYQREGRIYENCRFCRALSMWDLRAFRQSIIDFLIKNHTYCRRGYLEEGDDDRTPPGAMENDSGGGRTTSFAH